MKCAYFKTCVDKEGGAACPGCDEYSISLVELIVRLQEIAARHGNMPVKTVKDSCYGRDDVSACEGYRGIYTCIDIKG